MDYEFELFSQHAVSLGQIEPDPAGEVKGIAWPGAKGVAFANKLNLFKTHTTIQKGYIAHFPTLLVAGRQVIRAALNNK